MSPVLSDRWKCQMAEVWCSHDQCLEISVLEKKMLNLMDEVGIDVNHTTFYIQADPEQIQEMNRLLNAIFAIDHKLWHGTIV